MACTRKTAAQAAQLGKLLRAAVGAFLLKKTFSRLPAEENLAVFLLRKTAARGCRRLSRPRLGGAAGCGWGRLGAGSMRASVGERIF